TRLTLWVYAASFGLVAVDAFRFILMRFFDGTWTSAAWLAAAVAWCASLALIPWLVRWFAGPPPSLVDAPARRSDASFALAWLLVYAAAQLGAQLLDKNLEMLRELAQQPPPSDAEQLVRVVLIIFALGAAFAALDEERAFARFLAAIGCATAIGFTAYAW